jgi:serine/threonine protein kinase
MQTYLPGTRIGQYEIASRPMMGGMGVVYFALDHGNDDRPVALKTFRPELLPERAARDRFLREGTAWVELGRHPHIVRCYEVKYIDPTAFLVLELIAKEQNMPDASLRSWLIPGHPLPIGQALLYALQIARGMQHATEKIPGFVHRDLKPENILVGADRLPGTNINRLRVTDFGLVKTIAGGDMPAKAGNEKELKPNQVQFTQGAGTPLYMAPEQWKGEPVGFSTDAYAFGCILYEMISGQYAATGKTLSNLQTSHCEGRLHEIPSSLENSVKALMEKCLRLEKNHRYSGWKEIVDVLELSYALNAGESAPQSTFNGNQNYTEDIQLGLSYLLLGYAYQDIGNVNASIPYYEKALNIGLDRRQRELIFTAYNHFGMAHKDLGQLQQAIYYFHQALVIAQEIGAKHDMGGVLSNLGDAYDKLGDAKQAVKFCKEAITIAKEYNDLRMEGNALGNLGGAYSGLGEIELAIDSHEQALEIDRKIDNRRGEADDLHNIADIYRLPLGNYEKAIKFLDQALSIRREIGDRKGEGATLRNLGTIYRELDDFEKALKYLELALLISREVGDFRGEGIILCRLGLVNFDQQNYDGAVEYFQKASEIHRKCGDRYWEGIDLGNLGTAFLRLGNYNNALIFIKQALEICNDVGNLNGIALSKTSG